MVHIFKQWSPWLRKKEKKDGKFRRKHLSKRVVQRGKKTSPVWESVCPWLCSILDLPWITLSALDLLYSLDIPEEASEERAYKYPDIELSYYDFTTHFFPQIFIKHLHRPDPGLWTWSTHNPWPLPAGWVERHKKNSYMTATEGSRMVFRVSWGHDCVLRDMSEEKPQREACEPIAAKRLNGGKQTWISVATSMIGDLEEMTNSTVFLHL